jgi:cytochrome c
MLRKLVAAVAIAVVVPAALAEERATTREAEALVRQAAAFLKKEGRERAFAVFSDPHGPFTYRDLYMTVYDLEGRCLAHGAKKERIGKSLVDDRDADGKLFVRERVELARKAPKGWQEYKFLNPATKRIEDKVAYFEVVDGLILLSGAYKP